MDKKQPDGLQIIQTLHPHLLGQFLINAEVSLGLIFVVWSEYFLFLSLTNFQYSRDMKLSTPFHLCPFRLSEPQL